MSIAACTAKLRPSNRVIEHKKSRPFGRLFLYVLGLGLLIEHIPIHLISPECFLVKTNHSHFQCGVFIEKICDGVQGNVSGLREGESIDPGGNRGKVHTMTAVFYGQCQRIAVTGGKCGSLVVVTTLPYRAGGMNHIVAGEVVGFGDFSFPWHTTAQRAAFGQKFRPCGTVDGAVHAGTAQQRGLSGVDDSIHMGLRNIA